MWPKIPEKLSLWRRLVCHILPKSFGISNAASSCVKRPSNSTNCYLVELKRRPKYILEIRQRTAFLQVISNCIYKLFKDFTSNRKKIYRTLVFNQRLLSDALTLLCYIESGEGMKLLPPVSLLRFPQYYWACSITKNCLFC